MRQSLVGRIIQPFIIVVLLLAIVVQYQSHADPMAKVDELDLIEEAAGTHADRLDLAAIARAERERRGFPVMITNP